MQHILIWCYNKLTSLTSGQRITLKRLTCSSKGINESNKLSNCEKNKIKKNVNEKRKKERK